MYFPRIRLTCALSLLLASCSVKPRDCAQNVAESRGGSLSVSVSGELLLQRKFQLVRSRDRSLAFRLFDSNLEPVVADLSLRYQMPSMPEMGLFESKPHVEAKDGIYTFPTPHLDHKGTWQMDLLIYRSGTVIDRFRFALVVE